MRLFSLLALILLTPSASAQADALVAAARRTIDANAEAPDSLLAARARLQIAGDAPYAVYYSALADYRLAYAFWASSPERAAEYAAQGARALAALASDRLLSPSVRAEAGALQSALLSAQVGLNPALAMSLGGAAQSAIAEARRLAPDNPRVLLVSGIALQSTPPEWGGNPVAARAALHQATERFAADSGDALAPRWGEGEAWAWIAMSHLMAGDAEAARPALEAAERLTPDAGFVRYKLRPWLDSLGGAAARP